MPGHKTGIGGRTGKPTRAENLLIKLILFIALVSCTTKQGGGGYRLIGKVVLLP